MNPLADLDKLMNSRSIHLASVLVIAFLTFGWIIDRNSLQTKIDKQSAGKPEQKASSKKPKKPSEPDYKKLKEYELYDRYLNKPNQIWITYRVTNELLNDSTNVAKKLSDELITNLWNLWKNEDHYNISEWGIEHHSSEELAALMLASLNCSNTDEFRAKIKQHPKFQSLEDSNAEAISWLGPKPMDIYPEFHQPNTAEYKSFDEFLARAFAVKDRSQ